MARENALIVEVVGDTSKLSASLNQADRQLKGFASRTSRIHGRGADQLLAEVRQSQAEAEALQKRLAGVGAAGEAAGTMGAAGMGAIGAAAAVAYQAAGRVADALEVTGDKASTTEGQLRNAGAALLRFDVLGAALAFNVRDQASSWEEARQSLDNYTSSNRSWLSQLTRSTHGLRDFLDKTAQLVGLDPKLASLTEQFNKLWEAAHPPTTIDFSAISGDAFGVTPLDHLLGKTGAGTQRKGITAAQRNTFFDNRIARELDRVQDIATVSGQVSTLRTIAAEIQKRIDATKDITRRLNLEDSLVAVNRRAEALLAGQAKAAADAAAKAAKLAEERAAAEKERTRKLREAAAARRQARQFVAIGLSPEGGDVIPRVANLRKQLDQLTSRQDAGSIPSKMQAALRGVSRVLKGEFGKVTEDTRSAIQDLFSAVREELDKGSKSSANLTPTTQLSERILAGLGLSAADARTLRARISHFNSAGVALTGAGSGVLGVTVPVTVNMDGKTVAQTSAKYNRRGHALNPSQRNGPNAGLVIS